MMIILLEDKEHLVVLGVGERDRLALLVDRDKVHLDVFGQGNRVNQLMIKCKGVLKNLDLSVGLLRAARCRQVDVQHRLDILTSSCFYVLALFGNQMISNVQLFF